MIGCVLRMVGGDRRKHTFLPHACQGEAMPPTNSGLFEYMLQMNFNGAGTYTQFARDLAILETLLD